LGVAVLTYGLWLGRVGFYWDDLPISWIRYELGPEASRLYFSTNRPVWGELYQITTRLFPHVPIYWQVFALFWRWLGVVAVWGWLRLLWPGHRSLALLAALLFLLYPGQNYQWVAFLFSHIFIVLFCFVGSYWLMFWSFRASRGAPFLTVAALILTGLHLWMMEYFFSLELARPFFIFAFLVHHLPEKTLFAWPRLLRETIQRWLPYLAVFLANVLYRLFVFSNTIYQNVLVDDLRANPTGTIGWMLGKALTDVWTVTVRAWLHVFRFPVPDVDGLRATVLFWGVVLAVGLLVAIALGRPEAPDRRLALWAIGLGMVAAVAGSGPYLLARLEVTLGFPANRFTLSFMLGVSLLVAGVLHLLPSHVRLGVVVVLLALAAGRQVLWGSDYVREWNTFRTLFWQMTWRAPGLTPYTTVLLNDRALLSTSVSGSLPPVDARVFDFYADNSLSAALNWVYDPEAQRDRIRYVLLYPKSRLGGSLPALERGLPLWFDYIAGTFHGNTSQVAAFYYAPPGCLRVLDPDIDAVNRFIPEETLMRQATALSSSEWILPTGSARPPEVFGPEPRRGWCYYFEQADLARQQGDWEQVVRLAEIAFALDDYPNDPTERFVFIEGYAHVGNWERAKQLSVEAWRVSKEYMAPMLCRLWERIAAQTEPNAAQREAVMAMQAQFACQE